MPRQVYMCSYIEVGPYIFRRVHAVKIKSSWKTLGDTAVITLPTIKNLKYTDFKIGMPVLIKLGFDDDLYEEFRGYVSHLVPGTPLVIECMDEIWKLKQQSINNGKGKSWANTNIKEVITYLVPSVIFTDPNYNVTMGEFSIRSSVNNVAQALQLIKDKGYGIVFYFRNTTAGVKFYAGLAYTEKNLPEVNYHFQKNAWKGSLEYKTKEDIKVKIIGKRAGKDGKEKKFSVGDDDGDTIEINYPPSNTDAQIKAAIQVALDARKYTGYRGIFRGTGIPRPVHSASVNLYDDKFPELAGSFFIDSIETNYSSSGFWRDIELGRTSAVTL